MSPYLIASGGLLAIGLVALIMEVWNRRSFLQTGDAEFFRLSDAWGVLSRRFCLASMGFSAVNFLVRVL